MRACIFFLLIFICSQIHGQDLSQVVKGSVKSQLDQQPLPGANVSLLQNDKLVVGSVSDADGNFKINVAAGRYKLVISFTGYQTQEDEVLVIAGRELSVSILLQEQPQLLNEVIIRSGTAPVSPGLHTISIEKTMRLPAVFFDPVRMATSYPGVVAANDGSNSIIVKGYSPNGVLWRLQGLDIVNPNHLANAGTLTDKPSSNGGGVNVLSAQLLDHTNFYSGYLPVQYGNALSGVMDMNLRQGSKDKFEFIGQASLIGLDVAAEGPLDKKKKTSLLANYRYSTIGLLSSMGINFGDEKINFQDFSFHLDVDQKKGGNLSVFGFGGLSSNRFNRKPEDQWKEEKDRYNIDFDGKVFGLGFTDQWSIHKVSFSIGSAISGQQQTRTSESQPVAYAHVSSESYNNDKLLISNFIKVRSKISNGGAIEGGVMANYLNNNMTVVTIPSVILSSYFPNVEGVVKGILWQPYLNFTQLWTRWKLDAGLRYVNFSYNNASSVEPRVSLQRNFLNGSLSASYGITGQWQQLQTYLVLGNQDLKLTRAHQAALEFRYNLGRDFNLISTAYYHMLFDVPFLQTMGTYSVLNQFEDFAEANLNGSGKGRSYGIEASVEKKFYNKTYFMLAGSFYRSQYLKQDLYFDTRFSGNFTTSALGGKEWIRKNKNFGVHVRVLYLGGMRTAPISTSASYILGTTVYDLQSGYVVKLSDYFRTDFRASWRKNKRGYTRTIAIDIQNLFNTQNVAYSYFDTYLQAVKTKYQLGIVPILVYRVEF